MGNDNDRIDLPLDNIDLNELEMYDPVDFEERAKAELDIFERIVNVLLDNKEQGKKIISKFTEEQARRFHNYWENTKVYECRDYLRALMSYDDKTRKKALDAMPEKNYKELLEYSLVYLFDVLVKVANSERKREHGFLTAEEMLDPDGLEQYYKHLSKEEITAFKIYLKAFEGEDYGGNGDGTFRLSAPKVLRPFKTLQEILGKALVESLMQQSNEIREGIRERQVERYERLIEEAERIQRVREEELENDLEEGFSRGRGRHGH